MKLNEAHLPFKPIGKELKYNTAKGRATGLKHLFTFMSRQYGDEEYPEGWRYMTSEKKKNSPYWDKVAAVLSPMLVESFGSYCVDLMYESEGTIGHYSCLSTLQFVSTAYTQLRNDFITAKTDDNREFFENLTQW